VGYYDCMSLSFATSKNTSKAIDADELNASNLEVEYKSND